MRLLFYRLISLSRATALDWRAVAAILTTLIASQGCGIISDSPSRPLSTRGVSSSDSQTSNPSVESPPMQGLRRETPPVAKGPSRRETQQPPPSEKIPELALPTTMETGLASWYGPKFHGKLTASGEVFNQEKLTAAHPTLPLGSRVKVTNLDNGKSVDLRINDRGPYKGGRIIDVSRAAARTLGMVGRGIAPVRVERLADPERRTGLQH
jgi:rare lipoprotein A (peptidoglycan hydrolase)